MEKAGEVDIFNRLKKRSCLEPKGRRKKAEEKHCILEKDRKNGDETLPI